MPSPLSPGLMQSLQGDVDEAAVKAVGKLGYADRTGLEKFLSMVCLPVLIE